MRKIQISAGMLFRPLTLLFVAVVAVGCGPLITKVADSSHFDKGNDTRSPNYQNDIFLNELASRFGLMSLFAEVVYRRDLDEDLRDQQGCRYVEEEEGEFPLFGMPQQQRHFTRRWKRWVPNSENSPPSCYNQSGLYYETYVLENAKGRLEEAVIAFRGTENRWGQYFSDWSSNFAAAFGMEPTQYRLARENVPDLIKSLKDQNPGIKIYATGHSLGGGLAQQAGYLSKDVLEVFTFNTSPVTNWSRLRFNEQVGNAYPIFHRIYHGGEFLEKVRFVATSFTKARYGRHDLGLQLESRSSLGGHSMQIIACTFAEIIEMQGIDNADHFYPLDYIREAVIPKTPGNNLCGKNTEVLYFSGRVNSLVCANKRYALALRS